LNQLDIGNTFLIFSIADEALRFAAAAATGVFFGGMLSRSIAGVG
jgi:hypothetical protein